MGLLSRLFSPQKQILQSVLAPVCMCLEGNHSEHDKRKQKESAMVLLACNVKESCYLFIYFQPHANPFNIKRSAPNL